MLYIFLSFFCEFIDASIGMGYGTILSPLLIALKVLPHQAVPAVLIGQLFGGISGGVSHHLAGNVTFDFKPDREITRKLKGWGYMPKSQDAKAVFILAICGFVGAIFGSMVAVNIPGTALKTYIGVMVLGIGVFVVLRKRVSLSTKGILGLGVLSAFNKGISGGGYGPLVTSGQLVIGREVKSSVGSTTASEVVVCLVGFLTHLVMGSGINWELSLYTSIGAVIAAPIAAFTIRRAKGDGLKVIIGVVTVVLGIYTLIGVFS